MACNHVNELTGAGSSMRKIAIVGAGISGLVAADALCQAIAPSKRAIHVFEARDRVGGRCLSVKLPESQDVDLGATWILPDANPELEKLSTELGVKRIPEGDGAFCFKGGSQVIANKLAESLRSSENVSIHLKSQVISISRSSETGDIKLLFRASGQDQILIVDSIFIACPPRLAQEHICFKPSLESDLIAAMKSCRTWMAQQSKFVAAYESKFWNFHHRLYWERASVDGPLDVFFEHGNAIWGFLSNKQRWRSLDAVERKHQVLLQLQAMLGDQAMSPKAVFEQDWSGDISTCSTLDVAEPHPWQHPIYRHQKFLACGRWDSSLWFIGSETSSASTAGFMEGAVEAARHRVRQYLDSLPHKN